MRRRFLVTVLVSYAVAVAVLVLGPQVLAKRSATPVTSCTGALVHVRTSDMVVPEGAICRVSGSNVDGTVTVLRGAYFEASGTQISGSVSAKGALTVFLHDGTSVGGNVVVDSAPQLFLYKTTVRRTVTVTAAIAPGFGHVQVCDTTAGQIEVKRSGPDVLVGDPQGGCPGNTVKNDVVIIGNQTMGELVVSGNTITGSLIVTGNTGPSPKHVLNNAVRGTVELSNNEAPFDSTTSSPA